jgi:glutamine---fructose-6-phosphate transaminase (isomerizing)
MTLIGQEIQEQPEVARRVLAQVEQAQQIATAVHDFDPAYIMMVARGTSDNAARYAQYLWGMRLGLPVALATPSLYTLYDAPQNLSRGLVVGISQSGQSADIRAVLDHAQAQGALTVSLTNDAASPMAQSTAHHLDVMAGPERSVAATKSYTAQLAAVALLGTALAEDAEMASELASLPDALTQTLTLSETIPDWVQRYRYMDRFAAIGRGLNYATAYEISLKIKELCYVSGEEYSEADFRHGPIALVGEGFPVVLVMPEGKPYPLLYELLETLLERRAEVLAITNRSEVEGRATQWMRLPPMPEWLSPIVAVIPGQIFAKSLAEARGHEVDTPRGLNKVTSTQ